MVNSADPEANWSESTLFAKQGISGFCRTRVNDALTNDIVSFEQLGPDHDKTALIYAVCKRLLLPPVAVKELKQTDEC